MPARQARIAETLPRLWLISDARNDAVLEAALSALPPGSGLIFRHYHLDAAARRARFEALKRPCREGAHWLILAGAPREARHWGADGCYGSPRRLTSRLPGMTRLATVHDMRELGAAARIGADAVLISPVFATRSHEGARPLGLHRFRALAAQATMPAIALGGMDGEKARRLGPLAYGWAAIDGLSIS